MWKCKHCNKEFDFTRNTNKANHTRHCDSNPGRKESYKNMKSSSTKRFNNLLGKFKTYKVVCNTCGNEHDVKEREKQFPLKEQYYCSRACANAIGGKAKSDKYHTDDVAHYRTVAWRHHVKKCAVCEEDKIVAIHHLNEIHTDNDPKNLLPLCPTHHHYMHSKYRELIQDKVDKYLQIKWAT